MSELHSRIDGMLAGALPRHVLDLVLDKVETRLQAEFTPNELEDFWKALEHHGEDWGYQPSFPVARSIVATLVDVAFAELPVLGLENIREAVVKASEGKRVVVVGNHLSYGDVNCLQALLYRNGVEGVPLLVMAGPKVYRDPFRRMSSMCFETIKMAQPPSRASDGADVSMRELAEITRKVMADAEEWQRKGRILYFFPEGSRSRSGQVERFISASARYCSGEDVWVYPVGFVGTENLMGVQNDEMRMENGMVSIGKGLSHHELTQGLEGSPSRQRKVWMDLLGYGVASLLPKENRGIYELEKSGEDAEMEEARRRALTVFSNS
jgi:1-acyl-sn-glycerol-3-phosphate acyltransferase